MKVVDISRYKRAYSNWLSVLYQSYRVRNKVEDKSNAMIHVILKGSKKILDVPYPVAYSYTGAIATYNPKVKNITIDGGSLAFCYDGYDLNFDLGNGVDLNASFFSEEYNFLKVKGKDVIDIGANIGDTAIYFAIKGAKKIISLEPYPYTFALAQKNLRAFITEYPEFKDIIEVINAGYGDDKEVKIDTSFMPDSSTTVRESSVGQKIRFYSLRTLVSKYNIESGILKMDCEGCEYDLLKENNETMKKFSMVQIEYHYGYDKLVKKLKDCGFDIKYTEPEKSFYRRSGTVKGVGYIYGWQ
ncbi:MAG: FkbM family methyltransferase [Thermoplasmatales archaeon]